MKPIYGKQSYDNRDEVIAVLIEAPGEFEKYIAECRHPLECTYGTRPTTYPYLVVVEYDDTCDTKACTFITIGMFNA